jgi:predicted acetyltransferase
VELVTVNASNLAIYLNLTQAYEAEFSPLTKKLPDDEGKFALDTPIEGNVTGYLLYIDGKPAGLAAIANESVDHYEVCDFYVVPVFRKNKAGQRFAHILFDMMPGLWQSKQIAGADNAIAFWRRAIGSYTNEVFVEDIYHDEYWGDVTRQCFKTTA